MATKKKVDTEVTVADTVVADAADNTDTVVETKKTAKVAPKEEAKPEVVVGQEVVRETSQQLGIFSDYIYNVKHKDAVIVAENLGYGDIYLSTDGLAKVGTEKQRLLFGESVKFEGIERLYFTSASQPVVQILELK